MHELDSLMEERAIKIGAVKVKMNNVEDEVFADFCNQIGVENIRLVKTRRIRPPHFTIEKL